MTTIQSTDIKSISIAHKNQRIVVVYWNGDQERVNQDENAPRYAALKTMALSWGCGDFAVKGGDVIRYTPPAVDPTAPFINPPRPVELYPGAFDYWQRLALAIVQERRTWYPFWGVVCRELQDALKQLVARGYLREIVYKGYVLGNDVRKWDERRKG